MPLFVVNYTLTERGSLDVAAANEAEAKEWFWLQAQTNPKFIHGEVTAIAVTPWETP